MGAPVHATALRDLAMRETNAAAPQSVGLRPMGSWLNLVATIGAIGKGEANDHSAAGKIEIDVFGRPGRAKTEKTAVMLTEIVHSQRIRNPPETSDQPLKSAKNRPMQILDAQTKATQIATFLRG